MIRDADIIEGGRTGARNQVRETCGINMGKRNPKNVENRRKATNTWGSYFSIGEWAETGIVHCFCSGNVLSEEECIATEPCPQLAFLLQCAVWTWTERWLFADRVKKVLGQGVYGLVVEAFDKKRGSRCAVKMTRQGDCGGYHYFSFFTDQQNDQETLHLLILKIVDDMLEVQTATSFRVVDFRRGSTARDYKEAHCGLSQI